MLLTNEIIPPVIMFFSACSFAGLDESLLSLLSSVFLLADVLLFNRQC